MTDKWWRSGRGGAEPVVQLRHIWRGDGQAPQRDLAYSFAIVAIGMS